MATSPRTDLIREVQLQMGGGIVDLELSPDHYDYAITRSIQRYRQRSYNSLEESFVFLDVQPDVATYTLPDEVQEIRSVYRNNIGSQGGGSAIDPFSLSFTNNIYMLQNPGGLGGSGTGTLATFDFAMQFQSLVGRMFGRDLLYIWNPVTKKITLERRFTAPEQIMLHVYNARPETIILADVYARPWVRDYTVAVCKQIIGEARAKFGNVAGPQGGITLNGEAMKTEALAEMDRLEKEIATFVDQNIGWPFIIG